jgi:hypothetical protein
LCLFEDKLAEKGIERANIENSILLPSPIDKLVPLFLFSLDWTAKVPIIENFQGRKKKLIWNDRL